MSVPSILVDISFHAADTPATALASLHWTDVSAYVRGEVHLHRGRNHETQDFEAGTATLTLRDVDRAFNPANTASPYAPYVVPFRRIRIRALSDFPAVGTITPMFVGYIESWGPRYGDGNLAYVDLECADAFKYFNLYVAEASVLLSQNTRGRLDTVMNTVLPGGGQLWPTADRNTSLGAMSVQEQTGVVTNALTHMQLVNRTEGGQLYMDKLGRVKFEPQAVRTTAPLVGEYADDPVPAASVVPGLPTVLAYADLELSMDDEHIWNYIVVTREGGLQQTASDTASQTAYGLRRLDLPGMLFVTDGNAASYAALLLARYKDPGVRAVRLTIDPAVRNGWAYALGLEISQLIRVRRATLLGGSVFQQDCHIEAVDWRITKGRWLLTWALSPHNTATMPTIAASIVDKWIQMTLTGGWTNFGPPETVAGYYKEGDYVYLRGSIVGTSNGAVCFTLPLGYRPLQRQRWVNAAAGAFSSAQIRVDSDGSIRPSENGLGAGVPTTTYVSIQGVFKVT